MNPEDKYLTTKELRARFEDAGITRSTKFFRWLIRSCPKNIANRYLKFSDGIEYWRANPDLRPPVLPKRRRIVLKRKQMKTL